MTHDQQIPPLLDSSGNRFVSLPVETVYQKVIKPFQELLWVVFGLAVVDAAIFLVFGNHPWAWIEIPASLSLIIAASWLVSRIFKQVFEIYFLETPVKKGQQIDSDLFRFAKLLVNLAIIAIAIVIFAETHKINILGWVASLGIGAFVVVFVGKNILEQILSGMAIYLERPFAVDDYIGLPDGTFGTVESIGLRSTKIRTCGKGTLVIIPNSLLTQGSIENFTGVKKVLALIYLNFYPAIPDEERAAMQQVIADSTNDIFGLDWRNMEVTFQDFIGGEQNRTQVKITFFLLASGEVSMGMRQQLINIAIENIRESLKECGVVFDIEEPVINLDSPLTV